MAREQGFQDAVVQSLKYVRSRLATMDDSDGNGEALCDRGFLALLTELVQVNRDSLLEVVNIVGSLSVRSPEMNRRVAAEKDLVDTLLMHVADTDIVLSRAAVNTVMDIAITSEGRMVLQEMNVLDRFMFVFLWVAHFMSTRPVESRMLRGYFETALSAVEESLMPHPELKLEEVPKPLLCCAYLSLKGLWQLQHTQNRKENILPRFLARLGMQRIGFRYFGCTKEYITRIFLGRSEHFYKKHWEQSPALVKSIAADGFFRDDFLLRDFPSLDPAAFLIAFVAGSVSSPAVASDELDLGEILKDVQKSLGGPLRYDQDVRMVKCKHKATGSKEVHYFRNGNGRAVTAGDCLGALSAGYTIAIRGMEFRSPTIAGFCDSLASMLGQASIGANLYLTPPDAQGLSLHYDDHCVFVVQVSGQKRWRVYPSAYDLPRLYDARSAPDGSKAPLMDVLLKKGEVLYIPRGFPHQAFTGTGGTREKRGTKRSRASMESSCCSTETEGLGSDFGYSMHLTFAVEVEPPFTWEGFMHIAVHNFFRGEDGKSSDEQRICKLLLHFSMRAIASRVVVFRKACLVDASIPPLEPPQETYRALVEVVSTRAKFKEACKNVQRFLKSDEKPVWMNWFEHLPGATECPITDVLSTFLSVHETGSLKGAFRKAIRQFVSESMFSEVAYEEASVVYKELRVKYRDVRLKHALGLLALHHWYTEEANAPLPRDF